MPREKLNNEQDFPDDDSDSLRRDADLARVAAELESSAFVGALQALKPNPAALDQHRLMFEAGRQSAQSMTQRPAPSWSPTQAALLSSIASVAATVLLMSLLSTRLRTPGEPAQSDVVTSVREGDFSPSVTASDVADVADSRAAAPGGLTAATLSPSRSREQPSSNSSARLPTAALLPEIALDDWRQRSLHAGGELERHFEHDDQEQTMPNIDAAELGYAAQRRHWLTALPHSKTISDAH